MIREYLYLFVYGFLIGLVAGAIYQAVGLEQASVGIWIIYWLCVMAGATASLTWLPSWLYRTAPKQQKT